MANSSGLGRLCHGAPVESSGRCKLGGAMGLEPGVNSPRRGGSSITSRLLPTPSLGPLQRAFGKTLQWAELSLLPHPTLRPGSACLVLTFPSPPQQPSSTWPHRTVHEGTRILSLPLAVGFSTPLGLPLLLASHPVLHTVPSVRPNVSLPRGQGHRAANAPTCHPPAPSTQHRTHKIDFTCCFQPVSPATRLPVFECVEDALQRAAGTQVFEGQAEGRVQERIGI